MIKEKFAAAINCIDGRVQAPVADWIMFHHRVRYVDMITEPGADKVVSEARADKISPIGEKLRISINAHQSRVVAVVGHFDCAANPVDKEVHMKQIEESVDVIVSWNLGIRVIGLYVNELSSIELVSDSNADFAKTRRYPF